MPPKVERILKCDLCPRQKKLYRAIKQKVLTDEVEQMLDKNKDLFNIVMQFRKVCNHPEIFQHRDVDSPFVF
eukprot:UN25388